MPRYKNSQQRPQNPSCSRPAPRPKSSAKCSSDCTPALLRGSHQVLVQHSGDDLPQAGTAVCCALRAVCCVLCAARRALCAARCVLLAACCALCAARCALCFLLRAARCTLCAVCCMLRAACCALRAVAACCALRAARYVLRAARRSLCRAVLRCAALCCAVLRCAALCVCALNLRFTLGPPFSSCRGPSICSARWSNEAATADAKRMRASLVLQSEANSSNLSLLSSLA